MRAPSPIARRWSAYARPSRPHGLYAAGTRFRVTASGEDLVVIRLGSYNEVYATRPPLFHYTTPSWAKPIRVCDAAWLDAYTEIVNGPPPLAWLKTEIACNGLPHRATHSHVTALFPNGTQVAVLVSPEPGDEAKLARRVSTLETRKWRAWACVHRRTPSCCSSCRGAHPGRLLSTGDIVDRIRGGQWR